MHNNIIKYFEETVEKYNQKVCIKGNDTSITFKDLQNQSKCMAFEILKQIDNAKNQPIAVYLPKCPQIYVVDIACIYSGNIFMNLDVKTPSARIRNILEVINPVLVITSKQYENVVKQEFQDKHMIVLEDVEMKYGKETEGILENRLSEMIDTDPFCIINTSGSTGTPKGVVLNQRSFFDFVNWSIEKFGLNENARMGALSPVVFDIFEYELCLMMMLGISIVLIDSNMAIFPIKLLQYVKDEEVNFIFWVPSIMVNIANMDLLDKIDMNNLKTVWFAGEVFPTKQFNYWKQHLSNTTFANLYGPIEITLDCTYYIVNREFEDSEPLPIGYACENTDILILDEANKQCKENEVGEICVRGTSLAMGYYNNPEKTTAAFVQNPLNSSYPELIYRTGDLAFVNDKGEIIFKGRKDSLIKHMGYRIELSEIEHVLIDTLKLIQYGCIVYQYEKKEITLFYEEKGNISEKEIRKELAKVLPRYMVPTVYHLVKELPRNTNGKIDRLLLSQQINKEN